MSELQARLFRALGDILVADRGSRQRAAEQFVAALVDLGRGLMIVSHDSVIAGLKQLNKQDMFTLSPTDQASHMMGESNRSTIILLGATIERAIRRRLEGKMTKLNSEERGDVFNFNGPCGTFSSRIRIAQGLGIIDRETRKRIEMVREMRNTAAHSFAEIRFDVPEIQEAVAQLFPPKARGEIMGWNDSEVRAAFSAFCLRQGQAILTGQSFDVGELFEWIQGQTVRPRPWRDTPQEG